jgi:ATP-binding cassette subfamily B protein
VAIGVVQLAEPILFGRVVDTLSGGGAAFPYIAIWALLGLFGIIAGAAVAVFADRLAHRRHLAAMAEAFERAMTLPAGYHAERGSGAIIRTILQGTDGLFWLWLGALREQLTAVVGILLLVPTAIRMDVRMAAILGLLAVAYVVMNTVVMRRTRAGQANVEQYNSNVYGRVGDVISNVTVVQSFTRLKAEADAMRTVMSDLLAAQYPVLTWWGLLTVLQRSAATITMVAVLATGALLAGRGELSVGEIVAFVGFAGLLIGKLDQVTGFVVAIHRRSPALRGYFALLDAADGSDEKPGALALPSITGDVRYEKATFRFPGTEQGVFDLTFHAKPGQTIAIVGPTGSGKTTTLSLLQRLRVPDDGRILVDGHDIADVTLASLRRQIAVVFQDAGLFNRSLGEHRHRPSRRHARRGGGGGTARGGTRFHRPQAGRLRFRSRRAGRGAFGRRAPAHRHRPRHPEVCARPHPRRSDERARRHHRGAHKTGARSAAPRAHHLHHRPPSVHRR